MSTKVAGLAIKDGYTNVKVYLEGQPAWIKGGNVVYASKGNVEKGNIVLIDLRSKEKAMAGRIARSVSIPYESLGDRYDDIPEKAPIVLYSDSEQEVADAFAELRDEGFKKVALVSGNYDGWVKSGGKIEQGAVTSDINWVRKLEKGEVSKEDFVKVINGIDTSAVIVDVRTPDEAAAGGFPGAIAIPLDQIGSRLGELPKDKKIYVHCTTGARADMAAQELKKNGFDAFFIVATCECEGGEWELED